MAIYKFDHRFVSPQSWMADYEEQCHHRGADGVWCRIPASRHHCDKFRSRRAVVTGGTRCNVCGVEKNDHLQAIIETRTERLARLGEQLSTATGPRPLPLMDVQWLYAELVRYQEQVAVAHAAAEQLHYQLRGLARE